MIPRRTLKSTRSVVEQTPYCLPSMLFLFDHPIANHYRRVVILKVCLGRGAASAEACCGRIGKEGGRGDASEARVQLMSTKDELTCLREVRFDSRWRRDDH